MYWFLRLALFASLTITPFADAVLKRPPQRVPSTQKEYKEAWISDLDVIRNTFSKGYAPADYKKKQFGWTINKKIQEAKQGILTRSKGDPKTARTFVKSLFRSVGDYHVSVSFYSTESAHLPFALKSAEGRYFVSRVSDADKQDGNPVPFQVGDEVISIDGIPVHQVAKALRAKELGTVNYEKTDMTLATIFLTIRIGAFGHTVPQGPVELVWKPKDADQHLHYVTEWQYTPEIISMPVRSLAGRSVVVPQYPILGGGKSSNRRLVGKKMLFPGYYHIRATLGFDDEEPTDLIGARKSFLPMLGEPLFESKDSNKFHAYLFLLPDGRKAAYIRIPSYDADFDVAIHHFSDLIDYFEKESDLMVIDQLNNPGGSVFYMYALLSMLTDSPLDVPRHRESLTQDNVVEALAILDTTSLEELKMLMEIAGNDVNGYPADMAFAENMQRYAEQVVEYWYKGERLTSLHDLYGINPLMPHASVRYTKPLLILVNECDFSGGDFFPAIMQDNKRATIFGTRTAGAGGYVAATDFINLLGIAEFQYTSSIAERPSGGVIENRGVTPDIQYELTVDDLQYGYEGYRARVLEALQSL